MKTNEIITALRQCNTSIPGHCKNCPVYNQDSGCLDRLHTVAADTLETQLKRIVELEKERRWIPVTERLPEPGQIVLVHQIFSWEKFEDGAEVTVGRLRPVPPGKKPYWEFQHYRPDFRNGTIMDNDIICPGSEYITHWMPLPEPVKEVQL